TAQGVRGTETRLRARIAGRPVLASVLVFRAVVLRAGENVVLQRLRDRGRLAVRADREVVRRRALLGERRLRGDLVLVRRQQVVDVLRDQVALEVVPGALADPRLRLY